jgi:hypothetical protein
MAVPQWFMIGRHPLLTATFPTFRCHILNNKSGKPPAMSAYQQCFGRRLSVFLCERFELQLKLMKSADTLAVNFPLSIIPL